MPAKNSEPPGQNEGVQISNRDRVIFPESRVTKGELADYYKSVAPLMLPFAARRPVSLVRCPQGIGKKCFFQRHDNGAFGDAVRHVQIREKGGQIDDYLYIEDVKGLLQCVQMGAIEFHGWAALSNDIEAPDRMVFDLDPDEGLDFCAVKKAACDIRDSLSEHGLISFAMLSGGKGVHVVVPLTSGHSWEAHRDFAKHLAETLSLSDPDRFTAQMSKARRQGKIFIDWLRNQRGNTSILPYSVRARKGAPVATPIAWDDLKVINNAMAYTIEDASRLLDRGRTRFLSSWGVADQQLPAR